MAEALGVDLGDLVRLTESTSGDAEAEGLIEEPLGLVRDPPPEELRYVVELVRMARGCLAGIER